MIQTFIKLRKKYISLFNVLKACLLNLFNDEKRFVSEENLKLISFVKYTNSKPQIWCSDSETKWNVRMYCSTGANLTILLGGEHLKNLASTFSFYELSQSDLAYFRRNREHPSTEGHVKIGNDVRVMQNTLILSGVSLGDGCMVESSKELLRKIREPYKS